MNYRWLVPVDQRSNIWTVFHYSRKSKRLEHRPEYADLTCPQCRKVNEYAALRRGIAADVRVKSTDDWVETSDDMIVVSARLRDVLERNEIDGLEYLAIPKQPDYFVALPTLEVATDVAASGMHQLGEPCSSCGRYRETTFWPPARVMAVPDDPLSIFSSETKLESVRGRASYFCASERVVAILAESKMSGLDTYSI